MSRLALAAFLALLVAPTLASAKTFPIPSDDPIATVSIPESWDPDTYEGGVEATSDDGKIYIAVEVVEGKDVGEATSEGIAWFAKQGVVIDPKSLKTQETKVNGLPAFDLTMTGTDKNGPTTVDMTLVGTNASGKFLMLYFWGTEEGVTANAKELGAISDSIQATK